jgi:hypothetical protein
MATPIRYAHPFLPVTRADMKARGWEQLDIIIVTGDAYVDHPAFGPVLIARFLEGRGFKVGIITQPDWHSAEPFKALGKPRLFFGVAAGNSTRRRFPWRTGRAGETTRRWPWTSCMT